MTNLKTGILGAVAVAVVAVFWSAEHRSRIKLREENEALREQVERLKPLTDENARLTKELDRAQNDPKLPDEELRELLKLRGEVGQLRRENAEVEKLRLENQQLRAAFSPPEIAPTNEPADFAITGVLSNRRFKLDPAKFLQNLGRQVAVTNRNSLQGPLLQFFRQNGVDLGPDPRTSIFYNSGGDLWVRSSVNNLERIEVLVSQLNSGP